MWSLKLSGSLFNKTVATAAKIPKCKFLSSSTPIHKSFTVNTESTIDSSEVELFSKQMKNWWQLDGEMVLLHSFNHIRVPFVRDGLVQCLDEQRELLPLKDKKILDVGCGGGILSEGLAQIGAMVTGIDASKDLIEVAQDHSHMNPKLANNKPTYYHTSVEEHAKQFANHYDGVVASEVIEHVNNQELFVKSCLHSLKPGGRIFFTTPNRTRIAQCLLIFVSENILKIVPKGAHQYEKFITPNELTFLLEKNNSHVEATYGIQFNPITKKWAFSDYQHLQYAIQALKLS